MADLASSDVTVTTQPSDVEILGRKKYAICTIVFGDGALTYPSGGVPMPAVGYFGMLRQIDSLQIFDQGASGIVWTYDKTNRKLRGYIEGVTVSAAGSATLDDYKLNSTNDVTVKNEISMSFSNDATAGTYYLGQLKELAAASSKVPAQTLKARVVGW